MNCLLPFFYLIPIEVVALSASPILVLHSTYEYIHNVMQDGGFIFPVWYINHRCYNKPVTFYIPLLVRQNKADDLRHNGVCVLLLLAVVTGVGNENGVVL